MRCRAKDFTNIPRLIQISEMCYSGPDEHFTFDITAQRRTSSFPKYQVCRIFTYRTISANHVKGLSMTDRKSAEKHNKGLRTPNTRLNSATGSYLQTPVPQKDRLPTIAEGTKLLYSDETRVQLRNIHSHFIPFAACQNVNQF